MAVLEQSDHQLEQGTLSFLIESLFCDEQVEVESLLEGEISNKDYNFVENSRNQTSPPLVLVENDLAWEDEELDSLFCKERQAHFCFLGETMGSCSLNVVDRGNAVDWMLKVRAHYGFSALTVVLAMNYFDRFVSGVEFQEDEPWMVQLAAVTCLTLAAKLEETQVPLLLDIQVGESEYVFEAKTIQNMELLVMSTLRWRMSAVTPLSFLDHITRRLGLKSDLHWEFYRNSETLLLSVVADWRFTSYLPSVLATATMLHVIHQVEPCNAIEYQNQLLAIFRTTKEEIKECCELVSYVSNSFYVNGNNSQKRKYEENFEIPGGLSKTTDASFNTKSKIHKRQCEEEKEVNCEIPSSLSGITDASFSTANSADNDISSAWSVSCSPESAVKHQMIKKQKLHMPALRSLAMDIF
ncbi:hypothetical protein DCAR_0101509 [Daucus carota subsp. sativus]|uniref:Cyclin N-terminal domain-containing protein n=1 Tax=Daucus carota subsp. sativus TaxID=79200 RepID=A0AAF0W644_DAUCS|nr:PREDICTED: cyclin-D3-1-like [Daucus carota subsp. sativus]WOG82345.1 hypothetical protein DCAR_0101509 [Daucus carota subsp. sativus]